MKIGFLLGLGGVDRRLGLPPVRYCKHGGGETEFLVKAGNKMCSLQGEAEGERDDTGSLIKVCYGKVKT